MFRNSGKLYIAVNASRKKAFWSISPKQRGYKIFTLDKVLDSLNWILNNTYIRFGGKLFVQHKGVPMGGNCSPFIADLYLAWLEFEYMSDLMKNNYSLAKQLSYNSRYIDDILTPNVTGFLHIASMIYPEEVPLEPTTKDSLHDCFLDLDIRVIDQSFVTKVYHKVDLFNFEVISYPFPDSNIPLAIGYNTFLSQLIRFSRICIKKEDFAFRSRLLFEKLTERGYKSDLLRKYFIRFCCKMSDRVSQYGFYDFRLFYVYCMMNEHNNHMNTSSYDYHTINNSVMTFVKGRETKDRYIINKV